MRGRGMDTDDGALLYTVEICSLTGVECIRCRDNCGRAREERRARPWQGDPRVMAEDVPRIPRPDKSGKGRGNFDGGLNVHLGHGHGNGEWWGRAYG